MKFTSVSVLLALSAFVNAGHADLKDVLAKRQVNAKDIRMGTRRLSARQGGVSSVPSLLISQYIDCPAAPTLSVFQSSTAMRSAVVGVAPTVGCVYRDITDITLQYSCIYDGDSGSLTSGPALVTFVCPTMALAPASGQCAQACPRRTASSDWYTSSTLTNVPTSSPFTECKYASTEAEALAGTSAFACNYNTLSGAFINQNGVGQCPQNLGQSSFCLTRTAA